MTSILNLKSADYSLLFILINAQIGTGIYVMFHVSENVLLCLRSGSKIVEQNGANVNAWIHWRIRLRRNTAPSPSTRPSTLPTRRHTKAGTLKCPPTSLPRPFLGASTQLSVICRRWWRHKPRPHQPCVSSSRARRWRQQECLAWVRRAWQEVDWLLLGLGVCLPEVRAHTEAEQVRMGRCSTVRGTCVWVASIRFARKRCSIRPTSEQPSTTSATDLPCQTFLSWEENNTPN